MKKRFAAITLAAALTLGLTACGGSSSAPASSKAPGASAPVESAAPQTGASEVKAAILLPGTINDAGFSAAGYNGLMEAKDEFGLADAAYSESVPLAEQ